LCVHEIQDCCRRRHERVNRNRLCFEKGIAIFEQIVKACVCLTHTSWSVTEGNSVLVTRWICVFRTVLTINSDCFPKQHYLVGLCSGDVMCLL
jgi:hypothetical protein